MHRFLLHNNDICEASEARLVSPGQVGLLNGWGVFSTVRVRAGVLFAFERHFRRMQRDATLLHVPFPAHIDWLRSRLERLVEANKASEATLRVAIVRNKGGAWEAPGIEREFDLVAFTTALTDWGDSARLSVVPDGRHAASPFAGVKFLSWSMNLTWYEECRRRGFDEVVLLNERGEVSECTSANIFLSEDDCVWTPPLASGCLPGITRELLLREVHVPGIQVGERVMRLDDLERADEVFITSTTRDLMPVSAIEGIHVRNAGAARARLQPAFRSYIDDYVEKESGALTARARSR